MKAKLLIGTLSLFGGALGLSSAWSQDTNTTETPAAPLTQWTPDGVATFVQADDPALVSIVPPPSAPPINPPDPALIQDLTQAIDKCLTALSEKSSPTDTQYYDKGDWVFKNELRCCDGGPGALAAILWKYRQAHPETMDAAAKARQPWLHQVAVETMERGISLHGPDGLLANPGSHDVFWYTEFVNTYLLLKDTLDAATQQRWLNTMRHEVSGQQAKQGLPDPSKTGYKATDGWYVNGNVDILHADWIYLVWRATGEQQYKDLAELCWKHTLHPSQERWKGDGLYILKMPTKADGSDGAGYITESNDPRYPGFDKAYGSLQISALSQLYLKSRDPRVLRVLNLLLNAELPHVDQKTMTLIATYGSRHSETLPLSTSGPEVLTWLGGRSDLLSMIPDLIHHAVIPYFLNGAVNDNNDPGMYRGYGLELETILEAAMAAHS